MYMNKDEGYFSKPKEIGEQKCLGNTDIPTWTTRRPRPELGSCWFADRINMADSVTNIRGVTAAGSDLRHLADKIKIKALYMEKNTWFTKHWLGIRNYTCILEMIERSIYAFLIPYSN